MPIPQILKEYEMRLTETSWLKSYFVSIILKHFFLDHPAKGLVSYFYHLISVVSLSVCGKYFQRSSSLKSQNLFEQNMATCTVILRVSSLKNIFLVCLLTNQIDCHQKIWAKAMKNWIKNLEKIFWRSSCFQMIHLWSILRIMFDNTNHY